MGLIRSLRREARRDSIQRYLGSRHNNGRLFSYDTMNKLSRIKHCQVCKQQTKLETHHKVPLCKGGSNNLSNLIRVCRDCHKKLDEEALK